MKSKILLGAMCMTVLTGLLTGCSGGKMETPTVKPSASAPAGATASAQNDMLPGMMDDGTDTTENTATPSASATAKAE
ncbi:MAG: hypothetical protein E7418_03980 [Ruminococcaceae bacterium]|nr:hypothetical protein [Oscillospiraceae bacterium]